MSWGTQAVGKPSAVAAKVAKDLENIKLSNHAEQLAMQKCVEIISAVCEDFSEGQAVKVTANGSCSDYTSGDKHIKSHTLTLMIEPIHGFCE